MEIVSPKTGGTGKTNQTQILDDGEATNTKFKSKWAILRTFVEVYRNAEIKTEILFV